MNPGFTLVCSLIARLMHIKCDKENLLQDPVLETGYGWRTNVGGNESCVKRTARSRCHETERKANKFGFKDNVYSENIVQI